MPPASWHFADRPVPAPPPMMGWPPATMALNLSRRADRSKRGIFLPSCSAALQPPVAVNRAEGVHEGSCELRVVDVIGQADQLAARCAPHCLLQRLEQRGIGNRIVEGLS